MDHQRQAAALGRLDPELQRLDAVVAHGAGAHPHLHPVQDVAVEVGDDLEQPDVAVGEVGQLEVMAGEAEIGDVEEGRDADLGRVDDELAQPFEGERAGRSGIDEAGDPRARAGGIGVDAPEGGAAIDMGVQVDQPRGDIEAAGIDGAEGAIGRNAGLDRDDPVLDDRDIVPPRQPRRIIDRLPALDHQIEAHPRFLRHTL